MPACLCPDCSPTPAPTYTQEYRKACLARAIARMPHNARMLFLDSADPELRALVLDQLGQRTQPGPRQDALF